MKKILMLDESEVDKISECSYEINHAVYEITSRGIPVDYIEYLKPLLDKISKYNNEIRDIMGK